MAAALAETILTCERAVWEALCLGDAAADLAALAPDFLGVYPDGFSGRDAHAAPLADGPSVARYTISEVRVIPLGPDHALIAYLARYLRTRGVAEEAMYVSSVWRRSGAGWINVFSQDTPATGEAVP